MRAAFLFAMLAGVGLSMGGSQCPSFPTIGSAVNIFNIFFGEVFNKLSVSSTDSVVRLVQVFQDPSERGSTLKFVFEFERGYSREREYAGFLVSFSQSANSIPYHILKYIHSADVNDIRMVLNVGNLDLNSGLPCSDLKPRFLEFLSQYSYFPSTQPAKPSGPVGTVKILFPPLVSPNAFPLPQVQPARPSTNFSTFLQQNKGSSAQLTQIYGPSQEFVKKDQAVYNNYYTQQAPAVDNAPILERLNSLEGLILSRNITERNNVVVYPYPVQLPAGEEQTHVIYNVTQNKLETSTNVTPNVVIKPPVSGGSSSSQTQQFQVRPTEYLYNLQYGGTRVPETMTGSNLYTDSRPGAVMTGVSLKSRR